MRYRAAGFCIASGLLLVAFGVVIPATGGVAGLGLAAASAQSVAPSVPPATGPVLTPAAFAELLVKLQRQSFGDLQLDLVGKAVQRGGYFTCAQVAQLMRVSAFADDRVKIAATLYPRIVDPQNRDQLVATLNSDDDRQTLRNLTSP